MNPIRQVIKPVAGTVPMENSVKMEMGQVLIISFWNPTEQYPHQGVFIQEQAAAVCSMRDNVIFLQVNISWARNLLPVKSIETSEYFKGRRIRIDLRTRLWKFLYVNPWFVSRMIYRLIIDRKDELLPAVIHANVVFPCGMVSYLLAKRLNTRLLISEHWSKTDRILKHPLLSGIARKAYTGSYAIVCVSGFLAARIASSTGHRNILTIPNIIDTSVYSYSPKLFSAEDPLKLFCIATWRLPKRLDLIFEAVCAYAIESSRNIELTIAGTGEQAEKLQNEKIPPNLKINRMGYLDKTTIASILHRTHIFLHASEIETFSLVTAEALSTGTPVLVSDTGALPELVNESNGILVRNTPDSWLRGLKEIVARKFDYRAIALENQDEFSARQVGKSIIALYDNIISGEGKQL
jgi:glycosyltransferase involved in cell wall biosynthesis